MKQNIDLKTILPSVSRWLARFHTIVFFLIIGLSLIFCIFILLSIINQSGVIDQASAPQIDTQFDTQTIERVNELKANDAVVPFTLPSGRSNPFVE